MRRLCIAILLLCSALVLPAQAQSLPAEVSVPAGTPVYLHPQLPVTTSRTHTGSEVIFQASQPVMVDGVTVIPLGSPARGQVVFAKGAGMGHGARLLVEIDAVQAGDGSWIALRTTPQRQPQDEIVPLSVMQKKHEQFASGKDVVLDSSTVFEAYVDEPRTFSVAPAAIDGLPSQVQAKAPQMPTQFSMKSMLRLSDGTPIAVYPVQTISSRHHKAGDRLDFIVAAPLEVGGVVVVAAGAPARGTILWARGAAMFSQSGSLGFAIDSVRAVDGTWLDVHATTGGKGGNFHWIPTYGPAYVGVIPWVLPGTNIKIKKSELLTVYVNGDHYFALGPSSHAGNVEIISVPGAP